MCFAGIFYGARGAIGALSDWSSKNEIYVISKSYFSSKKMTSRDVRIYLVVGLYNLDTL